MWDVRDVPCSGCGMFGMWDARDVGCWGRVMFGMWVVGYGMLIYKMSVASFKQQKVLS